MGQGTWLSTFTRSVFLRAVKESHAMLAIACAWVKVRFVPQWSQEWGILEVKSKTFPNPPQRSFFLEKRSLRQYVIFPRSAPFDCFLSRQGQPSSRHLHRGVSWRGEKKVIRFWIRSLPHTHVLWNVSLLAAYNGQKAAKFTAYKISEKVSLGAMLSWAAWWKTRNCFNNNVDLSCSLHRTAELNAWWEECIIFRSLS